MSTGPAPFGQPSATEVDPVKTGRYNQYAIPDWDDPSGGDVAWVRATTIKSAISDKTGIEKWKRANVVLGMGRMEELVDLAAACDNYDDDKRDLFAIADRAEDAGRGNAKADAGTAFHKFVERAERGLKTNAPKRYLPEIAAHLHEMSELGISALAWEEVMMLKVIDPAGELVRIAGRFDVVYDRSGWELPRISDRKTGQDPYVGMTETAAQLAIYSRMQKRWNAKLLRHEDPIAVDQKWGIVVHTPFGQATPTVLRVDLEAGWEIVRVCLAARYQRSRKDLCAVLREVEPDLVRVEPVPLVAGPAGVSQTPEDHPGREVIVLDDIEVPYVEVPDDDLGPADSSDYAWALCLKAEPVQSRIARLTDFVLNAPDHAALATLWEIGHRESLWSETIDTLARNRADQLAALAPTPVS